MHVSLTPELECIVKAKVASGLYSNASEVISDALRFMQAYEERAYQTQRERLRAKLSEGDADLEAGRYLELASADEIGNLFQAIKSGGRGEDWRKNS